MSKVGFEVKSTTELWRRPYCIFTVSYPTTKIVCIQGLRGKFKSVDYRALMNIFYQKGFTTCLFEREIDGELVERTIPIKKPYRTVEGYTFKRVDK